MCRWMYVDMCRWMYLYVYLHELFLDKWQDTIYILLPFFFFFLILFYYLAVPGLSGGTQYL